MQMELAQTFGGAVHIERKSNLSPFIRSPLIQVHLAAAPCGFGQVNCSCLCCTMPMNPESEPAILKAFPHTRYHPRYRLVTWHPRGLFDEHLADRVVEFMEHEESVSNVPFDRYTDLTGFTEIRLKFGHSFAVAKRRREGYQGEPVKSALYAEGLVGLGLARMYEFLMKSARIRVRAFRDRGDAARWLEVPVEILDTPAEDKPQ
jgi:hypothetical protein